MGAHATKPNSAGPVNESNGHLKKAATNGTTKGQLVKVEPSRCLTQEEKELIKVSWSDVEHDVSKVGVIMFVRMFETHPDIKDAFMPFKGVHLDDMKQSQQLKSHALRVMGFLQKVVSRLDHPDRLEKVVEDNGRKHFYHKIVPDYIDYMGPQFLSAIEPSLTTPWSDATKASWVTLFAFISSRMKLAMWKEKMDSSQTPKTVDT